MYRLYYQCRLTLEFLLHSCCISCWSGHWYLSQGLAHVSKIYFLKSILSGERVLDLWLWWQQLPSPVEGIKLWRIATIISGRFSPTSGWQRCWDFHLFEDLPDHVESNFCVLCFGVCPVVFLFFCVFCFLLGLQLISFLIDHTGSRNVERNQKKQ